MHGESSVIALSIGDRSPELIAIPVSSPSDAYNHVREYLDRQIQGVAVSGSSSPR